MRTASAPEPSESLLPREVAALLRVDYKTVTRWARQGRLEHFRTPGGHRRYSRAQVSALMQSRAGVAASGTPEAGVVEQLTADLRLALLDRARTRAEVARWLAAAGWRKQ